MRLPDRVPRPQRRGRPRRRPAQPGLRAPGTRTCPGLKVIAPYTAADAKGLLKAAIRDPNPVVFLENEMLYGQSFDVPEARRFHRCRSARRKHRARGQGRHHRRLLASASTYALKAAEELAKEGIEAEVIDLRTIRPLDTETIVAVGEEDQPLRHGRGRLAAIAASAPRSRRR